MQIVTVRNGNLGSAMPVSAPATNRQRKLLRFNGYGERSGYLITVSPGRDLTRLIRAALVPGNSLGVICIMPEVKYNEITVQAAVSGWILKVKGQPPQVFVRWDSLVSAIELLLTSKGDPEN